MVKEHLETRFLLQKCKTSHFSDNDHPKPLFMAVQRQKNPLRRQVSRTGSIHFRYNPDIIKLRRMNCSSTTVKHLRGNDALI